MGLNTHQIITWNMSAEEKPDQIVDFEKLEKLPAFPKNCKIVLALNLLEHLYEPLNLLSWICENLPPGGLLVVTTPFCYQIHPSPHDFWRMTPEMYQKFFCNLEIKKKIVGKLSTFPLGEDLRDGLVLFTTPMFYGSKLRQFFATILELKFWIASIFIKLIVGKSRLQTWARRNPLAVGVIWTKFD